MIILLQNEFHFFIKSSLSLIFIFWIYFFLLIIEPYLWFLKIQKMVFIYSQRLNHHQRDAWMTRRGFWKWESSISTMRGPPMKKKPKKDHNFGLCLAQIQNIHKYISLQVLKFISQRALLKSNLILTRSAAASKSQKETWKLIGQWVKSVGLKN